MKHGKFILATFLAAVSAPLFLQTSALAAPETYEIDSAHSSIGFKVKHLFSYVTGRFDTVEGVILLDAENPEASTVNVTIKADSINTANAKRDSHLKTADFFNVEKFATLTYKSKSVQKTGDNTAEITGDLTMHGVTKEVPLKVQFLGKGPGMQGETRSGFQASAALKRSEFGLTWGKVVEGTELVGDDVIINLEIEAVKKAAEAAAK